MMDKPEYVLEIRNLSVSYQVRDRALVTVDRVSASFAKGRITGLIGESGCGKSTMTGAILGVLPLNAKIHSESEVLFDGENILSWSQERKRLFRWAHASMVFQAAQSAFNPLATLREQLLDSILDHLPAGSVTDATAKVEDLLRLVRLEPGRILDAYPHQLSGGMRQRAIIAMSLVLDPEFIILDEPTTALDTITQSAIFDTLLDIHRKRDLTLILITHDMAAASRLCDRMMVMYGGRIMETNSTTELFKNPVHPYSRGLVDSMPFIDDDLSGKKPIGGHPPDLLNPPSGCIFHPRCHEVVERCRSERPTVRMAGSVSVACWQRGVEKL